MPAILRISPAATGKTTSLVNRAFELAQDLSTIVIVVVPGYPQVRAWRRLLANKGGVLGLRVLTFPQLYKHVLDAAGRVYTRLSAPVQYRLVQSILDGMDLNYYEPLRDKPGFIQALLNAVAELKAGRIWPESFIQAVHATGAEPRLVEIARVYTAYQNEMLAHNWVDSAGMGWLTAEALDDAKLCRDWQVLYVDGFDDLTPVQIDVLKLLVQRVPEVVITLTGDAANTDRLVHQRYVRTRERLAGEIETLKIETGLSIHKHNHNLALTHLESAFLTEDAVQLAPCSGIELVAAPNRETEVRVALRWLKQRVVYDGMEVGNLALLARSIEPYRLHINQIADEFGIPIHMAYAIPLSENPCISSLMDLFSLSVDDYPRQKTIDVWFSPYFNWGLALDLASQTYNRVQHSRLLQAVAIWGKVIGGYDQWWAAIEELSRFEKEERKSYEDDDLPGNVPVGVQAQKLLTHFTRFAAYLKPPEGAHPYREFVSWLENMIGDFSEGEPTLDEYNGATTPSLGLLDNVDAGPSELRQRDQAALQAFKHVLRGFVWAEQTIAREDLDYPTFLQDLKSAIAGAVYHLPLPADQEAILVGESVQVRGISFDAVAVLGLAEGEFPTTSSEDPFLPDRDRKRLRDQQGLELNLSTESFEAGYFYDAVTRASAKLLITRPKLTNTGAIWQPSPFWFEVQRLVDVKSVDYTCDTVPDTYQLASQTEAIFYCAGQTNPYLTDWVNNTMPSRWAALRNSAQVFGIRLGRIGSVPDEYEGNLSAYDSHFTEKYGPNHIWSASRLESYSTCPFMFFTSSVLKLEPREEPEEGYDSRQLGNIYHHIFESLYNAVDDPTNIEQLMAVLPGIAGKILNEAPHSEQFRVTAWWMHSRQEIIDNVKESLKALHQLPGSYEPYAYEQPFGLYGYPPLTVTGEGDTFRLRGFIDRVDQSPDGRIRIIDYKTSGPYGFTASAVRQGKKLQLPLYALAVKDALSLGYPAEGFYWHVRDAEASPFTLAKFGPEAAIKVSVDTAWEIIHAVRSGKFTPQPPHTGCPSYCPAVGICWQYRVGYGL